VTKPPRASSDVMGEVSGICASLCRARLQTVGYCATGFLGGSRLIRARVVAWFALDGIAEAAAGSFPPYQCFAIQELPQPVPLLQPRQSTVRHVVGRGIHW
jgi:hypothetical protein